MFSNAVEAVALSIRNSLDPDMVNDLAATLANLFVPGEAN